MIFAIITILTNKQTNANLQLTVPETPRFLRKNADQLGASYFIDLRKIASQIIDKAD